MKNQSVKQKIVNNPITRLLLGLLVCVAIFIIAQNVTTKLFDLTVADKYFRNLFKGIIASIAVISAYKFFYKFIEKREVTEIATVFGLIAAIILLYINKKQNKFIKPHWKR